MLFEYDYVIGVQLLLIFITLLLDLKQSYTSAALNFNNHTIRVEAARE